MSVFFDGFEQFDKTEDLVAQIRKAGYSVEGSNLVMGDGTNGRCLVTKQTSVTLVVPWVSDKMSIGVSAKFSGRGGLLSINDNPVIADSVTGFLRWAGQSGTAIPIRGRWYFYDIQIDRASDTFELFINGKSQGVGKPDLTFAGAQNITIKLNAFQSPTTLEQVNVRVDSVDSSTRYFDNLYVTDGERFGPMTITTRFPSESITEEWDTHADGEGISHAEILGKLPSQELDRYIMTNKDGKTEVLKSDKTLPEEAGKVIGVGLVALVRKTNREDASIIFSVGNRTQDISDLPFVWGYRYAGWRVDDDPAKDSIEGAEIALKSSIRSV